MRKVAVVAWREIVEHRAFVWAALAALAVTLFVPLLQGLFGWSPGEVREVLTWVMALGFTWLSAILLGASTVSGTVAAGRFGFFMARPLSGAAIWFGKLIGVLAVLLVCELIVVLPVALLTDPAGILGSLGMMPWFWVGFLVGIPLLLVLLSHAIDTVWRARSAWIVLDLAALLLVSSIGWMAIRPLIVAGAWWAAAVVGLALVSAVAIVILGAGAVQASAGRCDTRRHHRSLSMVAWPGLFVLVCGISGYAFWLAHPRFGDLVGVEGDLIVQPTGEWIGVVAGSTRGRFDVFGDFALNLKRLEPVRVGIGPRWFGTSMAFSGNGRRAAWTAPESGGWSLRSGTMDSISKGGEGQAVFMERQPWMALSHRGDRVAVIEGGNLVVSSLPKGDLVGSVRLPANQRFVGPYFASEDRVRLLAADPKNKVDGPPSVQALEFDLAERKMREIGVLADAGSVISTTIDIARDRILLGTEFDRDRRWRYLDGRTFSDIPWASEKDFGPVVSMLADGRLVQLVNEDGGSWLEVISADGSVDGTVHLPRKPERLTFGFQPTPSTLVIFVVDDEWTGNWLQDRKLRLVDLGSGEIRDIANGYLPPRWWNSHGAVGRPLPVGCPASRVFMGEGSSLHLWDPDTGEFEELVSGRK